MRYESIRKSGKLLCAVLFALTIAQSAAAGDPYIQYLDSGQWSFHQDAVVRNDTLCATSHNGPQIWDVSDPTSPVLIGDYYTGSSKCHGIAWVENIVAVTTNYDQRLYAFEISDPENIVLHGYTAGLGEKADVQMRREGEDLVAYTAGLGGFKVIDMNNLVHPMEYSSMGLTGTPANIHLVGDIAFVSTTNYGLYALNVSDREQPVPIFDEALATPTSGVHADGSRMVVSANYDGFYTYDITDPENPVQRAHEIVNTGDGNGNLMVMDAHVDGTTLYLSTFIGGLVIYNISDLESPSFVGQEQTYVWYAHKEMTFDGEHVYIANWDGYRAGVIIVDVNNPASPFYVGRARGFDYIRFTDAEADMVYMATGHEGVISHQLTQDDELVIRGAHQGGGCWGIDAVGTTVYMVTPNVIDGFCIIDWSDPDNPQEIGCASSPGGRGVEVHGTIAYLAAFNEGFQTWNVADPEYPTLLDEYRYLLSEEVNVSVQGTLVASAGRNEGLNLWDVEDPNTIVHLGNYPTPDQAVDVELSGDYVYVCVNYDGLHVVDVSDPTDPQPVMTFPGYFSGCYLSGDKLHTSRGGNIGTYSLADPASPVQVATYDTPYNAMGISAQGNDIFVSDYGSAIALRYHDDTAVLLSMFDLSWDGERVVADWVVESDQGEHAFRFSGERVLPEPSGEVELDFEVVAPDVYRGVDDVNPLSPGETWRYTLRYQEGGEEDWLLLGSREIAIPAAPAFGPVPLDSYPNPFNPGTFVHFDLPRASRVRVHVYSLAGQRIATLADGMMEEGPISVYWDGKSDSGHKLSSGVYLARLEIEGVTTSACKLVMLR